MTEKIEDLTAFQCLRCGSCCCWPGDVRLSPEEQDRIAEYLQLTPEAFLSEYTRLTRDRRGLSLIDGEDGNCIFYQRGNGCLINDVKPHQCIGFPHTWRNTGWEKSCAGARVMLEQSYSGVMQ